MTVSKKLDSWFQDYEGYHRDARNKYCHYVGVPLIMMSLLGLLHRVALSGTPLTGALLLFAGVGLWAVSLDLKFGILFLFAVIPFYWFGTRLDMISNVILFAVGWIFQLVGHYRFEKKSPALKDNLLQLFIGPMWLLAAALGLRK
jgi:uncharacterized membrane protein YGL010W